ncbi:MAG: hypothetical protein WBA73_19940 [Devosia sp.]|jgi:hypothetical protein
MKILVLAGAVALAFAVGGPALAKDAWCYTTDDGEYDCAFEGLDAAGSFEISAPGKPTFQLWVDAPGAATVGAVFEAGGRSVALPGTYYRSEDDGACWVSDATEAEICAW